MGIYCQDHGQSPKLSSNPLWGKGAIPGAYRTKKGFEADVRSGLRMEQEANVETKAAVKAATKMYRVNQFAELAGVTVRALHHYDRLGLLKPSQRTYGGYRLYSESDLGRLEQIVVLKFLGLPLKQIRGLLRKGPELADALRGQQHVLAEKRRKLDSAIQAIGYAEHTLRTRKEPDWKLFKLIIQEVEMQNDSQWAKKYYSEAAQLKVEERKKLWSPELQERV